MIMKISILSEDPECLVSFYDKTRSVLEPDLQFTEISLSEMHKMTPDDANVIIIDYDAIKANTFEFIQTLNRRSVEIPIIIIATQIDDLSFNTLLNLNIYAYVEKDRVMNYVLVNYLYDIKKVPCNHAAS